MMLQSQQTRSYTGAEFLVHALVSAGVTHVFGGHGGSVVALIDALVAHPSITWVYCRCEVNASQTAMAYAKLTGNLGCCVATSGPGAAHLLSGIVDADLDRVPLICLTGTKDSGHVRYADFQDIDQGAIFRMASLAFSETVGDVHQLLPLTRNAFTLALSTNRCCHLAIPTNVQQATLLARTHFCLGTAYQMKVNSPATRLEIEKLVMALRAEIDSGRHVVIACGYRAAMNGSGAHVERLAELLHAPIVTSFDGKGTTDEHHPLSFGVVGVYGNAGTPSSVDLLEDCDTVIAVCVTDLSELITNRSGVQIRRLIQIDERLIAGDSLRFSPSAVFSCGYLQESLSRAVDTLKRGMELSTSPRHRRKLTAIEGININNNTKVETHEPENSMDIWEEVKKESFVKPTGTPSTFLEGRDIAQSKDVVSTEYCHPAVFFDLMQDHLEDNAVIAADIGDNALWMASSLVAKRGQRFLTSEHMGIMGFAINAGLAASLYSGWKVSATAAKSGVDKNNSTGGRQQQQQQQQQQTLIVAGDGGIQMSLNELATLRDHGSRRVLVVVIVNARLGRVQNEMWGPGLRADGCHIGSPDFVKLFEAYGYPCGMRVSTCNRAEISETIEKGWSLANDNGACVIELRQDPLVFPVMHKLKNRQNSRGLIHWETRTRNPTRDALFPQIETDHWKDCQNVLQDWLDSLNAVEKSEPFWFDTGTFASQSPSKILQDLLASPVATMPGGAVPTLFPTHEARVTFDSQFQSSFLNSFPASVIDQVLSTGTSNSHPLCLQLLVCPKEYTFKLHAHPNVELDIPLVGELWEKRYLGVPMDAEILATGSPGMSESKFYVDPSEEELSEICKKLALHDNKKPSKSESGDIVVRVAKQGQVLYNATGTIHQSFTKAHGCLVFALWSGVHANFDTEDVVKSTCHE